MQAAVHPRVARATVLTALASLAVAVGVLFALMLTYLASTGPEASSDRGGPILFFAAIAALASASVYVGVVFPFRARALLRRGEFSGEAFRRGQSVFLALHSLVAAGIVTLVFGGSFETVALLSLAFFLLSLLVCVPLAFLWLHLAR